MDYTEITKLVEPIKSKSQIQFKLGSKIKKVDKALKSTMYRNLKGFKRNKILINNNYDLNNFI